MNCTDVNLAAEILTTKLSKILDIMAPVKKFQTRTKYAPWMSKETKILKENREAAHKKATDTDLPEYWREFRTLRNQVTAKLRQDKQMWEKEKLDLQKNDPTSVWKTIKSWLG